MNRILIYALNYAPEPIGVGRYTGEIGAHFAAQGHDVRAVTSPPHYPGWRVKSPFRAFRFAKETRNGVRVLRCPIILKRPMRGMWRVLAPLSFALSSLPVVAWMMLTDRPDVLYCVEPTLFAAPVAVALAKLLGTRTVLHIQDLEVDAAFAVGHLNGTIMLRIALRWEAFLLRRFDLLITISKRMKDNVAQRGISTDRIALVRNWVDLGAIRPLSGQNSYRSEFGWPDSLFVALYSGSIGAKQGLQFVLDAAESLKEHPHVVFVIVGDGPAKPLLETRYRGLPNVRFLSTQPESRMCELLNLADLHLLPQARGIADLVLPSKLGGMLASGRPILATADPGTELFDVLIGSEMIVPPENSKAIANEIVIFLKKDRRYFHRDANSDLLQEMSKTFCLTSISEFTNGL